MGRTWHRRRPEAGRLLLVPASRACPTLGEATCHSAVPSKCRPASHLPPPSTYLGHGRLELQQPPVHRRAVRVFAAPHLGLQAVGCKSRPGKAAPWEGRPPATCAFRRAGGAWLRACRTGSHTLPSRCSYLRGTRAAAPAALPARRRCAAQHPGFCCREGRGGAEESSGRAAGAGTGREQVQPKAVTSCWSEAAGAAF